jgi:phage-related baseplate assembly protein
MALSLEDLITELTEEEIKKSAVSFLTGLGFPVGSWASGAIMRTFIAVFASVAAPFTRIMVDVAKSGFLDTAESQWLAFLSEQQFDYSPTKATFATGDLTVNNTEGGVFNFAAREFRVLYEDINPAASYVNVDPFSLGSHEMGKHITIEAEEIGSRSTAPAGAITTIVSSANGVECTNEAAVVGIDAESDASIKSEARLSTGPLSPNGPYAAYEFVARNFALNGGVVVTKAKAIVDNDLGIATLYVAGPSGPIGSTDIDKIQDAINRLCKPLGFDCVVASAVELELSINVVLAVYTSLGIVSADLIAKKQAQLIAWIQTLPIGGDKTQFGGRVLRNAILGESFEDGVSFDLNLVAPATDVAVASSQVVTPGAITVQVTQVSPT